MLNEGLDRMVANNSQILLREHQVCFQRSQKLRKQADAWDKSCTTILW